MNAPARIRKRLLDRFTASPWQGATVACIVMFSVFSLVLSTITLTALFDSLYAPLIAFLIMLTVQTFATVNAVSLFQPFSKLDAVVAFVAWLFLTTMSVVTNWGVWFDWLSAKDYARAVYNEQAQEVSDLSTVFADRYERIATDAKALEEHSGAMAKIEDTQGGTCHDGAGRSQGPRWQLRTTDAANLDAVSSHFGAQAQRARAASTALIEALRRYDKDGFARSSGAIQAHYATLRTLAVDPELKRVPAMLEQRLKIGREGWEVNGQRIRCPDAELEALARRLITAAALPAIPERPVLFEPTMKNSIRLAYGDLFGSLFSGLSTVRLSPPEPSALVRARQAELAKEGPTPADVLKASPWLWFFAALPDLMIVLAAWRLAMRSKVGPEYAGPVSGPFRRLAAWKAWSLDHDLGDVAFSADGRRYDARKMLEVLIPQMSLTPRIVGRRHRGAIADIYVPAVAQDPDVLELRWLMTVLEALKAVSLINPAARVSDLPGPIRATLADRHVEVAAHYELDRSFYEDLVVQALGATQAGEETDPLKRLLGQAPVAPDSAYVMRAKEP